VRAELLWCLLLILLHELDLPLGRIMLDDAVDWACACEWLVRIEMLDLDLPTVGADRNPVRVLHIVFVFGYRREVAGVDGYPLLTPQGLVRDVEDEIVVVVALGGIIPADHALVDVVDVARQEWERIADQLYLWDEGIDLWVRTEVDVLAASLRLLKTEQRNPARCIDSTTIPGNAVRIVDRIRYVAAQCGAVQSSVSAGRALSKYSPKK